MSADMMAEAVTTGCLVNGFVTPVLILIVVVVAIAVPNATYGSPDMF
jgi:hypothetical protein